MKTTSCAFSMGTRSESHRPVGASAGRAAHAAALIRTRAHAHLLAVCELTRRVHVRSHVRTRACSTHLRV
eukprot:2749267-Pleurochrysis_carterae.AAC.2